jgi:hypothetical protein
MPIFVPEWQRSTGREQQIKRSLGGLDEDHVVRRPLRPAACAADMFVQHPSKGWIAIAVASVELNDLDPTQLFASEAGAAFDQRLQALAALATAGGVAAPPLPTVVILWSCSTEDVRRIGRVRPLPSGVRLVSKEQFVSLGAKIVSGLMEPQPQQRVEHLLGTFFPEAEIPAVCTTRSLSLRDNDARLKRFFLDQDQEWAAKLDIDFDAVEQPTGSAGMAADFSVRLVNGVAGSGKTLIAAQRALLLAELFPRQRILLLIHNTPVVADLTQRLRTARGELPPNLEVMTSASWAARQWRLMTGRWPDVLDDRRELLRLVGGLRQDGPALSLSDEVLADELDYINESAFAEESDYLDAQRGGRGFALRAGERAVVWKLHGALLTQLRGRRRMLWSMLPTEVRLAQTRGANLPLYGHILIDEAQFFTPSWFQLVKGSVSPRGQIFLCADPKQGFLRYRMSWKSAGLEVAGRTKRLRRSYRTTQALLASASAVLDGIAPRDREDDLEPEYVDMEVGTRPMLIKVASPQDAVDRLINELGVLTGEGLPLTAFLVMYGDNVNKAALYSELTRRFGMESVWWFNEKSQKRHAPGGTGCDHLRMANLETATGLEALVVFMLGAEPLFAAADAAEVEAERGEGAARKLYMAFTRAGRKLVVLSSQQLAPRFEALFDRVD